MKLITQGGMEPNQQKKERKLVPHVVAGAIANGVARKSDRRGTAPTPTSPGNDGCCC